MSERGAGSPVDVSCVIPVRDGERYLPAALESVFRQTAPPREIIVVDDGSTDGTAALLESYSDRIVAVSTAGAGPGAARNHGVRRAGGEYVAFLDADDLWHPEKLERQANRLAVLPDLRLIAAYYRNFWSPDVPPASRPSTRFARFTHDDTPREDSIITWVVRRDTFETIGGFREDMVVGSDTEWFDRFRREGGAMETMPQVLARRRLHAGNLTFQESDAYVDSVVQRIKDHIDRNKHR